MTCPNCNSDEFDIIDTDGDPIDKIMDFKCSCLDCNTIFILECYVTIKEIKNVS